VRDQVENGDSKSRKGVSHLTVSRGVTTLPPPPPPGPPGWRFRSRDAKHNARPRYGKSANREAILGRRKRRRDLDSTVRESNEN